MVSRPVSTPIIDIELSGMVNDADLLIAGYIDQQLALELAREYARYLMGHREKSPKGDGLSIMQNQYIRSEAWRIVRRHASVTRDVPQWERRLRERGVLVY